MKEGKYIVYIATAGQNHSNPFCSTVVNEQPTSTPCTRTLQLLRFTASVPVLSRCCAMIHHNPQILTQYTFTRQVISMSVFSPSLRVVFPMRLLAKDVL